MREWDSPFVGLQVSSIRQGRTQWDVTVLSFQKQVLQYKLPNCITLCVSLVGDGGAASGEESPAHTEQSRRLGIFELELSMCSCCTNVAALPLCYSGYSQQCAFVEGSL